MQLLSEIKDLQDLKDTWAEVDGVFHVEYRFYYPYKLFYNSNGRASSKAFDLTNTEKLLQDAIFRTLDIDDKYVFCMKSSKHPAEMSRIDVVLKLETHDKAG